MYNVILVQHTFHTDTRALVGEQYGQAAWWTVDLGASYDVYKMVIVNGDYFIGICVADPKNENEDSALAQLRLMQILA